MKPSLWAAKTIALLGPPEADPTITPYYADIDYLVDPADLGGLQDALDELPAVCTVVLTIIANVVTPGGSAAQAEIAVDESTDETVFEGVAYRSTLPESSDRASTLVNRVYGPKGGWERLVAAYGEENISPLIRVGLRYPPQSRT